MSKEKIVGIVSIEGGAFYDVKLQDVPRVGDFIDLFTLTDAELLRGIFEVVQVVHTVHAVWPEHPEGAHSVAVVVKQSDRSALRVSL